MDLIESRGWSLHLVETKSLQVKESRVCALVGSFELPDSPFIIKLRGSRENM